VREFGACRVPAKSRKRRRIRRQKKKRKKTGKIQIIKVSEICTQAKYRMVDVSFLERG